MQVRYRPPRSSCSFIESNIGLGRLIGNVFVPSHGAAGLYPGLQRVKVIKLELSVESPNFAPIFLGYG